VLTPKGPQCDVCDKFVDAKDNYWKTYCPLIVGEMELKKPIEARTPAMIVICPGCKKTMKTAIALRSYGALPNGRLKQILAKLLIKFGADNIHWY
jgi:hypothetical protein